MYTLILKRRFYSDSATGTCVSNAPNNLVQSVFIERLWKEFPASALWKSKFSATVTSSGLCFNSGSVVWDYVSFPDLC